MTSSILSLYNPKIRASHRILEYYAESLNVSVLKNFIKDVFQSGEWGLATKIGGKHSSVDVRLFTRDLFVFNLQSWVDKRIEFTESHSTRHYVVPKNIRYEFENILFSLKHLSFEKELLDCVAKFIENCDVNYFPKLLEKNSLIVVEEWEVLDIEMLILFLNQNYLINNNLNYSSFLFHFLNNLAFSHKIFLLTKEFINSLVDVSIKITSNLPVTDDRLLSIILLVDLCQNKKLDLKKSNYKILITQAINDFSGRDTKKIEFYKFLRRFKFDFDNFNPHKRIQELFNSFEILIESCKASNLIDLERKLHYIISTSYDYFELFLFYQEISNSDAYSYFDKFLLLVDELRSLFSNVLFFNEYSNLSLLNADIVDFNRDGFEAFFNDEFLINLIDERANLYDGDNLKKYQRGFFRYWDIPGINLNRNLKNEIHKLRGLFSANTGRHDMLKNVKDITSDYLKQYYIVNLNYSTGNKGNIARLIPAPEGSKELIQKFDLKGFFHFIEVFLVKLASQKLCIRSPFLSFEKGNLDFLLVDFRDLSSYKIDISDNNFWKLLETRRPKIYSEIYLKEKKQTEALVNVVTLFKNGGKANGLVLARKTGGLVVDFLGLEAFLPGSQVGIPISDFDTLVGQTLEVGVVKVDEQNKNIVLSRFSDDNVEKANTRRETLSKIIRGNIIDGVVKNITGFGAFIDLGQVDGLLHISDLSWGRVQSITDFVEINEKIKVVVLDFDNEKTKIHLGLKQLTIHPWDNQVSKLNEGDLVKGKVVKITDYGAFLEVFPGVDGLLHISEMNWSVIPHKVENYVRKGDDVDVVVLRINSESRTLVLSLRQKSRNPWEFGSNNYRVGNIFRGQIVKVLNIGIIVQIEGGIMGLAYRKMSGSQKHFYNQQEYVNVRIEDIDFETRKVSFLLTE